MNLKYKTRYIQRINASILLLNTLSCTVSLQVTIVSFKNYKWVHIFNMQTHTCKCTYILYTYRDFANSSVGKESCLHRFDPQVRKIPWRRKWQPTLVFLPRKSQGQRSLVGYSPQGCKESDTTKQLTLFSFIIYIYIYYRISLFFNKGSYTITLFCILFFSHYILLLPSWLRASSFFSYNCITLYFVVQQNLHGRAIFF